MNRKNPIDDLSVSRDENRSVRIVCGICLCEPFEMDGGRVKGNVDSSVIVTFQREVRGIRESVKVGRCEIARLSILSVRLVWVVHVWRKKLNEQEEDRDEEDDSEKKAI